MITVEGLAEYIGVTDVARNSDLTRALAVASLLVDQRLVAAWRACPSPVRDQMVLDVAYDLFKRSENNTGQYDSPEALRASNDPLRSVRDILKTYVMVGL